MVNGLFSTKKKKHIACQNKLENLENLVYHEEI
jgi:hypothetical protein